MSLVTRDGTELRDLLRRTRGNRIDLAAFIGRNARGRVPCRLVATRLGQADTGKHRRMRNREARKRGATASREGLLRDRWRPLATNLPLKTVSAKRLNDIYALRWSIEIRFRDLCRKHGSGGWLGIGKRCDFSSIYLLNVRHPANAPPFDPDLRHLGYEKRRRANHWQAIIHSLG